MTRLKKKLVRQIAQTGPISVSDFMAQCLFDPAHGYYTQRQPFGADGDFVTAPEISQLFGELIGVWVFATYTSLGAPQPVTIAEIGPGRGTMMKDIMRTIGSLDNQIRSRVNIALIETSPRLKQFQERSLSGSNFPISWYETVGQLPGQPLIVIGNELFDAIPVRQYIRHHGAWKERMVIADAEGELGFAIGSETLKPTLAIDDFANAADGTIIEISPQRGALMETVCKQILSYGGAALFVDYGSVEPAINDTLQAVRNHEMEDVFANPGLADLTTHVDFSSLAAIAAKFGLRHRTSTQAEFLLAMGLLERAGALGANADSATRRVISAAVDRLASTEQMGSLFKVLAIGPQRMPLPPFDPAD